MSHTFLYTLKDTYRRTVRLNHNIQLETFILGSVNIPCIKTLIDLHLEYYYWLIGFLAKHLHTTWPHHHHHNYVVLCFCFLLIFPVVFFSVFLFSTNKQTKKKALRNSFYKFLEMF